MTCSVTLSFGVCRARLLLEIVARSKKKKKKDCQYIVYNLRMSGSRHQYVGDSGTSSVRLKGIERQVILREQQIHIRPLLD